MILAGKFFWNNRIIWKLFFIEIKFQINKKIENVFIVVSFYTSENVFIMLKLIETVVYTILRAAAEIRMTES